MLVLAHRLRHQSASLCLALLVAAASVAIGRPAYAQTTSGVVTIRVSDAESKSPVSFARVVIFGPTSRIGFADESGTVTFEGLPTGAYQGNASKDGYGLLQIPRIDVADGRVVTASVSLAKRASKIIGRVVVRTHDTADPNLATESSVAERVTGSLQSALSQLPRINTGFSGFSSSRAGASYSIDGQSSADTGLALNGIPLGAVGGPNLGINPDLFSGASVGDGAKSGALSGNIDFQSLEPTIAWQTRLESSAGSFDQSSAIVREQGSAGDLGVAFIAASRTTSDALNHQRYADASGMRIMHDTYDTSQGLYGKLRAQAGASQTLAATYIGNGYDIPVECTVLQGTLPCGYGFGNILQGTSRSIRLADTAVFGNFIVNLTGFVNSGLNIDDEAHRRIGGVPYPFSSRGNYINRGITFESSVPAGRHTIGLAGFTSGLSGNYATSASYFDAGFDESFGTHFSRIELSDSLRINRKATVRLSIGSASSSGTGSGFGALTTTYAPTARDRFTLAASHGILGTESPPVGRVADPSSLLFDCTSGFAFANAPGDVSRAPKQRDLSAQYTHAFGLASITLSAYDRGVDGGVVEGIINGSQLDPRLLPANYLAAGTSIRNKIPGCGSAPLTANQLYFAQPLAVRHRDYSGIRSSFVLRAGNATIVPYYNVQAAKVTAGDSRFSDSSSVIALGAQLPGVPLQTFGIQGSTSIKNVNVAMDVSHVGTNNGRNLPAFALANFGVSMFGESHAAQFSVSNLFNTYSGRFDSFSGGVPLRTLVGSSVPTIGRAVGPRQFNFVYRERVGRGNVAGSASDDDGPTQIAFRPATFPVTPPPRPFEPNVTSPNCTPSSLRIARPLLEELTGWTSSIEKAKVDGRYPEAFPSFVGPEGFKATYRPFSDTYAAEITLPQKFANSSAFMSCSVLHFATVQKLNDVHAYLPATLTVGKIYMDFTPSYGLYLFSPQNSSATPVQIATLPLPQSAPTDPFALRSAGQCLSELRPIATHLLKTLADYVALPATTAQTPPDGWSVIRHSGIHGDWLELSTTGGVGNAPLLRCGFVHKGSLADIQQRGFGAGNDINYSQELGLYEIGE